MKSNTIKTSALLLSLFLGSLTSTAYAGWYNCGIQEGAVLGSGDFVCCRGTVDSTDLSSLQLTQGTNQGVKVTCMDKHNPAWVWTYVGFENGCSENFSGSNWYGHAYRCEQQAGPSSKQGQDHRSK
ncbi:MAG: hypothetical protein JSS53_09555 [Proteobacteria bacterium]|nr:hypothetical protein [Pseudomonadota bacterium]